MGYLDNSIVTVDAILTKKGRELLARGDGSFKITQFALSDDEIDLRRHLQDREIVLIESALQKSNGKISNAADLLKLRRTTLIEKMKKFSISRVENN